ncbi:hypothetical protein [Haloarchaeobius sp. DFWS5]
MADTLGWSLISSGLVTLALIVLPGPSLYWGIAMVVLGVALLYSRASRY